MLKRKKAMESLFNKNMCPQCGLRKMKTWQELSFEEQLIAEKMPLNTEFSKAERKKHRFCTNCWHEETEKTVIS